MSGSKVWWTVSNTDECQVARCGEQSVRLLSPFRRFMSGSKVWLTVSNTGECQVARCGEQNVHLLSPFRSDHSNEIEMGRGI